MPDTTVDVTPGVPSGDLGEGVTATLPSGGGGTAWLDSPDGFDLGLGFPVSDGSVVRYCPEGFTLDEDNDFCWRLEPFEWEEADPPMLHRDYTYQYRDYTYRTAPYVYQHRAYTYTYRTPTTHEVRYPTDDCSYLPNPNSPSGLDIYCQEIIEHEPDDPPAGWDWSDDFTQWQQLDPTPNGWTDTGDDWVLLDPAPSPLPIDGVPTSWTDVGDGWELRDDTPTGWTDTGDGWEKRDPIPTDWTDTGEDWIKRAAPPEGWVDFEDRIRKLAPGPDGATYTGAGWKVIEPTRTRLAAAMPASRLGHVGRDGLTTDSIPGGISIAGGASATEQSDGTLTYSASDSAAEKVGAVGAQVLADAGIRLAVSIPGPEAPQSFAVPLIIDPTELAPAIQPDGSVYLMRLLYADDPDTVDIIEEDEWETVYVLPPPWAKDANGRDVRTWYVLDGTIVTQHIHADEHTAWPIVADPTAKAQKAAIAAQKAATKAQAAVKKAVTVVQNATKASTNAGTVAATQLANARAAAQAAQKAAKDAATAARKAENARTAKERKDRIKAAQEAERRAREDKRRADAAAREAKRLADAAAQKAKRLQEAERERALKQQEAAAKARARLEAARAAAAAAKPSSRLLVPVPAGFAGSEQARLQAELAREGSVTFWPIWGIQRHQLFNRQESRALIDIWRPVRDVLYACTPGANVPDAEGLIVTGLQGGLTLAEFSQRIINGNSLGAAARRTLRIVDGIFVLGDVGNGRLCSASVTVAMAAATLLLSAAGGAASFLAGVSLSTFLTIADNSLQAATSVVAAGQCVNYIDYPTSPSVPNGIVPWTRAEVHGVPLRCA